MFEMEQTNHAVYNYHYRHYYNYYNYYYYKQTGAAQTEPF